MDSTQRLTKARDRWIEWTHSPEYVQALSERLRVIDATENSSEAKQLAFGICAKDPIKFIELFGWVYDPRPEYYPNHIPLILFDYQKDTILWLVNKIKNGEDGLLEKSRDMGATWLFIWVFIWFWRFSDSFSGLLGSYKQDLVDNRCYSDDTEVLTKSGWKLFKNVDIENDFFATRNIITKEFEWQKATDKVEYDYDGEFYNLKSRTVDLMVSPNHRVLYSKYWGKYEYITKAKDLYGYKGISIPATSIWKGVDFEQFILYPKKSEMRDYGRGRLYNTKPSGGIKMSGDDFCAFMGMYIAEGCISCRNKKYDSKMTRIHIAQIEKSKGFKQYQELLMRIFGKEPTIDFRNGQRVGWIIRNKMLYEYLKQFGYSHEKFVPQFIKNASKRQLEIFLHYYMLGDGYWGDALPTMTTVSKKLADDLQEIIQKIGNSSSISIEKPRDSICLGRKIKKENVRDSYVLRIRTSKQQNIRIEKTQYNGKIYCVTVPNEILYVRRNGKPIWCGNTLDSHFGKIDYCLQQLPKWLLPARFNADKHRQSMKLVNPESGNLITGDTMNPDFARGSRKTAVFLDEGASWEYFREAWESSGDTTPCRLTASTPKGHNAFALLRDEGIDVKTLHWKLHPLKDQDWYDYEKSRRSDEEVAQELDISYNKSQEGRVYPEFDNCEWGTFLYDPFKSLYVSWDFGGTDSTAIIWFQPQDDGRIAVIDSYSNNGKFIDFYVPFITGVSPSQSIGYTKNDYKIIESHKNWHNAIHFGDPAGRFKNQVVDKTVLSVLAENGIHVNFLEDAKDFSSRRNSTKIFLRNMVIHTNDNNKQFAIAIENASYPKMRTGGGEEVKSVAPKHDWTSHFRSSLEYMAVNYLRRKQSRQVKDKFNKTQNGKRTTNY